jgi:hypothetical protein
VSATGPFDLMIKLAEHRADGGGALTLVPVVDSELDRNYDLYDAGLRRLDGVHIACDRMTEPRVRGVLNRSLADPLKAALATSALALEIDVEQDDEDVVVRRADGVLPTNESERLVLKFLAALFDGQLLDRSLAAISWSELLLDDIVKETLWELIRVHLPAQDFGRLQTLVLIAGGYVDYGVHCEEEPSIRFALREGGLAKRKGPASLEAAINKLTRHPDKPFVFFLGAGCSRSADFPLGNDVRDYALERFFGDKRGLPPPVSELALRFHNWVQENDRFLAGEEAISADDFVSRLTLERVLREEFRRDGREDSPTLAHLLEKNANAIARKRTRVRQGLQTILSRPHQIVVVTVNFDTILEDELGDRIKVFARPASFDDAPGFVTRYLAGGESEIPVLKLHGTLDNRSSIIADVDARSLGLPSGASEALGFLRGTRDEPTPWVYVGASMRDPDVTEVIGMTEFAEKLDEWWVSPLPDPPVEEFARTHRSARWIKSMKSDLWARQITETADRFFAALARAWPNRV